MEPYLSNVHLRLTPAGDLNWESVQSLLRVLGHYPHWSSLELDLSEAQLIDSSGLVFMAQLLRAGHSLTVINPPSMLAELIHMSGLQEIFQHLGGMVQPIHSHGRQG